MPAPPAARTAGTDSAREVVRWGAFCCVLVPLVLLACGSPPVAAAGTGAALTALTAVCWALLTVARSASGAARTPPSPRTGLLRSGGGTHRAGRRDRR